MRLQGSGRDVKVVGVLGMIRVEDLGEKVPAGRVVTEFSSRLDKPHLNIWPVGLPMTTIYLDGRGHGILPATHADYVFHEHLPILWQETAETLIPSQPKTKKCPLLSRCLLCRTGSKKPPPV